MVQDVEYLFDSSGNWIAFCKGGYVFNQKGEYVGWIPWRDGYVVDIRGNYFGSIIRDQGGHSRFYYFLNTQNRGYPGHPGYPGPPSYPGYPGFAGHSPLPPMARDIQLMEAS